MLYEALESPSNILRASCFGKHVLEMGSGSGLLARPLEQIAASALLTDLPECLENCRYNINANCKRGAVSCCALDFSALGEVDAASRWSFDVLLGADICYDPSLVTEVVRAFKELLWGHRHRKGYLVSTRRSHETTARLAERLSDCEDVLVVNDVTSETKQHLGKFPYSFWDCHDVLVYELVSR